MPPTRATALGRPHLYSPLLLRLPAAFGRAELTPALGIGLALAFILALLVLPAPAERREAALLLLAVVSPDTAFALERANMDVLIFVAVALGGCLLAGRLGARIAAYALFLAVGLLKFYPLVLLVLVLRERPGVAAGLAAAAVAVAVAAVAPLAGELGRALANILPHPPFAGTFGAEQLAQGIALLRPGEAVVRMLLHMALATGALAVALHLARDMAVAAAMRALPRRHGDLLLVGGLLVVGCFAAGQSVEYRAIFLLLAMPALLVLGREARLFRATAGIVVWLMWDPVVRRIVARLGPAQDGIPGLPGLALWTLRELLWWWVAAVLSGLLLHARRVPAP